MGFRLVLKLETLNDLERRDGPNFMDNLRLLCLVVNVCRGKTVSK